jgi:GAF domain-containing protein
MTDHTDDLLEHAGDIARRLHAEPSVALTAQAVVDLAVELLQGCDAAGVTMVRRKGVETVAHSHPLVLRGDSWQYELGEGPCLDALDPHKQVVESDDLTEEARWPRWAPRVVNELGVRSMLSFRLFTASTVVGALNLYSSEVAAFPSSDHDEGLVLAGQAALAIASSQQVENLKIAVSRRTTIGQAQGILMERFGLDSDQAFAVLVRLSRNSNRRLFDLAETIVATRRLPSEGHLKAAEDPAASS